MSASARESERSSESESECECCACHETSRFAKSCACHEICTSRFTKCCACHDEVDKVLCLPRNLQRLPRNLQTSHMPKSHGSLQISQNQGMPKITTTSHVQSAAPATKSALRSKTAPIPCTCHEKSTSRLPSRKVTIPCPKMCVATQRERGREKHRLQPPRFCEPAQSEVRFEDFERHACTVNSSELAGHVGDH